MSLSGLENTADCRRIQPDLQSVGLSLGALPKSQAADLDQQRHRRQAVETLLCLSPDAMRGVVSELSATDRERLAGIADHLAAIAREGSGE